MYFFVLGSYNNDQCNKDKPQAPTLLSGVSISPTNIQLQFFKSLLSGYEYYVNYHIKDKYETDKNRRAPSNFGPVQGLLLIRLEPNTIYDISARHFCIGNKTFSGPNIAIQVKTLPAGMLCNLSSIGLLGGSIN